MYGMFEANFLLIVVISDRERSSCDRGRSAQPIGALIRDVRKRRRMSQCEMGPRSSSHRVTRR